MSRQYYLVVYRDHGDVLEWRKTTYRSAPNAVRAAKIKYDAKTLEVYDAGTMLEVRVGDNAQVAGVTPGETLFIAEWTSTDWTPED